MTKDDVKKIVRDNKSILDKYKVTYIALFGSYVRNEQRQDSDIDFLVTFGNVDLYNYFDNYLDFKEKLEQIYERKVDLVEEQTIKNPFLMHSINQNKQLIWTLI